MPEQQDSPAVRAMIEGCAAEHVGLSLEHFNGPPHDEARDRVLATVREILSAYSRVSGLPLETLAALADGRWPRVVAVSRHDEEPRAIWLLLEEIPTDDEMQRVRKVAEALAAAPRAPEDAP